MKSLHLILDPPLPDGHITFALLEQVVVNMTAVFHACTQIKPFTLTLDYVENTGDHYDVPTVMYTASSLEAAGVRRMLLEKLGPRAIQQNSRVWAPQVVGVAPDVAYPKVLHVLGIQSDDGSFQRRF